MSSMVVFCFEQSALVMCPQVVSSALPAVGTPPAGDGLAPAGAANGSGSAAAGAAAANAPIRTPSGGTKRRTHRTSSPLMILLEHGGKPAKTRGVPRVPH